MWLYYLTQHPDLAVHWWSVYPSINTDLIKCLRHGTLVCVIWFSPSMIMQECLLQTVHSVVDLLDHCRVAWLHFQQDRLIMGYIQITDVKWWKSFNPSLPHQYLSGLSVTCWEIWSTFVVKHWTNVGYHNVCVVSKLTNIRKCHLGWVQFDHLPAWGAFIPVLWVVWMKAFMNAHLTSSNFPPGSLLYSVSKGHAKHRSNRTPGCSNSGLLQSQRYWLDKGQTACWRTA